MYPSPPITRINFSSDGAGRERSWGSRSGVSGTVELDAKDDREFGRVGEETEEEDPLVGIHGAREARLKDMLQGINRQYGEFVVFCILRGGSVGKKCNNSREI